MENSLRLLALSVCLVATLTSSIAKGSNEAESADSLSFQGYVTDEFDDPIDTASVAILFKIYRNGVSIWEETHPSVTITNGVFDVLLGSFTPLDSVDFTGNMSIGITIGGDAEISPRTPLVSAAFARSLPAMRTYYRDDGAFTKSYNVVGGDPMNSVDPGASAVTISGGGGIYNNVPYPHEVSNDFATIGGGRGNAASGHASTIGGGSSNTVSAGSATIGGGSNNEASGSDATVGGGQHNEASGDHAIVAGGWYNVVTNANSGVGSGYTNTVHGTGSAIGGGVNNLITGNYSVIPGGSANIVRGGNSVAMGSGAIAHHDRSFVYNNSLDSNDTLKTTATDQFLARATNGYTFYTDGDGTTGVTIGAGGGAWAPVSDVNAKTNFGQTDPSDVLERLVNIPVQTWRYKSQDESITHMGPTAQDFYAAFGLGYDDKHIVTVDADGVSFAAIQGLYKLVREQQAEIERLRRLVEGE